MIHNLLRIAEKAELELNEEQLIFFATVTGFNINARYDDYKQSFYQKCTQEFAAIRLSKKFFEPGLKFLFDYEIPDDFHLIRFQRVV